MTNLSPRLADVKVGDALPELRVPLTSSLIVAGAVASRDFTPVHHDKAAAQRTGMQDVFMNILTTEGFVSRFVTDWAGPHAMIRQISIRLGVPAVPRRILRFTGEVTSVNDEADERRIELAIRVANDLGDHATGSVVLTVPR